MKSSPSKGSPERRQKNSNMASSPTASQAELPGMVTRATARRLSIQLSTKLPSPKKRTPNKTTPLKTLNKSKVTNSKNSKLKSVKEISPAREKSKKSPTMNTNNEQSFESEKPKKNFFQESHIVEEDQRANTPTNIVTKSSKLDTSASPVSMKLSPPRVHLPSITSPSKSKQKLDVPNIPNKEVQHHTDNSLNIDIKEEEEDNMIDVSKLQPNKSDCTDEIKDEEISKQQGSDSAHIRKNTGEIRLLESGTHLETCIQVAASPKSPKKDKQSSISIVKNPVTPKKVVIEDKSETDDDSDAESRKEIMRSAEKRIIRNISTSESESRHAGLKQIKMTNFIPDSTGSDSDSAPEDVTFDASRKSAFDVCKIADESIKRDKQRKKELRKERLEMIRQRKEDNLIRLKERKANLEDASCSSSEESVHDINAQLNIDRFKVMGKKTYIFDEIEDNKKKTVKSDNHLGGIKRLPSELLENLPDHLPKKLKPSHSLSANKVTQGKEKMDISRLSNSKTKRDIDFIPVSSCGSTQFGVVPLNKPQLKTVAQQAADFRNNMLYGNRVDRVPANTIIKNRLKLKVYK